MYAAPEALDYLQVDGSISKHGRGTDIFSLGCVFSEMLSVIYGYSVNQFHEFLLARPHVEAEKNSGPGAAAARRILLYSRVTDRMAPWFSQGIGMSHNFVQFIEPMIRLKREDRPDARGVMRNVPTHLKPCRCDDFNQPSDRNNTSAAQHASNATPSPSPNTTVARRRIMSEPNSFVGGDERAFSSLAGYPYHPNPVFLSSSALQPMLSPPASPRFPRSDDDSFENPRTPPPIPRN